MFDVIFIRIPFCLGAFSIWTLKRLKNKYECLENTGKTIRQVLTKTVGGL